MAVAQAGFASGLLLLALFFGLVPVDAFQYFMRHWIRLLFALDLFNDQVQAVAHDLRFVVALEVNSCRVGAKNSSVNLHWYKHRAGFNSGQLVLSWPRAFQRAVLESTRSVGEATWAQAPGVTWEISDTATNEVEVQLTRSTSQSFYRLRW